MRVTLQVIAGPETGRRVHLRAGQVARIGGTRWADFSFPNDADLDDIHFEIACGPRGCRLRDLSGAGDTRLDGEAVAEAAVRDGQRILAGGTTFLVRIENGDSSEAAQDGSGLENRGAQAARPSKPGSRTVGEVCQDLQLEDESQQLLRAEDAAEDFLKVLIERRLFRDAIRVQARCLTKRDAVRWGCLCLRGRPGGVDGDAGAAIAAAERWVLEPTEEHRRAAEAAASRLDFTLPAAWLARAAFWSEGSIAPAGAAEVPPPPFMSFTAVAVALILAAPADPSQAAGVWRKFLAQARDVAEGQRPPPKA